jgi:hypothetical protein
MTYVSTICDCYEFMTYVSIICDCYEFMTYVADWFPK